MATVTPAYINEEINTLQRYRCRTFVTLDGHRVAILYQYPIENRRQYRIRIRRWHLCY